MVKALHRVISKLSRATKPVATARPVFEGLEQRQYFATAPLPVVGAIKVKNLFDVNGVSINQSLVTVPFDQKIQLLDASKIGVRGYIIDLVNGGQKKILVHTLSITLGGDQQSIIINTDRLMRKDGGKILIGAGALAALDNTPVDPITISSPKGQNKERFTLACRSFRPTDVNFFTQDLYPSATASIDVSTPLVEANVTASLTAFLDKKVAAGLITADQKTAALSRYNDDRTKAIIPDANLRAAIVSLVGTVAEQTIAAYLEGQNATGLKASRIVFGNDISASAEVAETTLTHNGRLQTVVRTKFSGEPFQALSTVLAHEVLRQDGPTHDGLQEDVLVNAVRTFVWAQQLLTDSAPASIRSDLVRLNNDRLYAMINSGKFTFPRVGIEIGANINSADGVFPLSAAQTGGPFTSFENFIRRIYQNIGIGDQTTPGNVSWTSFFTKITGSNTQQNFSNTAIDALDGTQQIITDKVAIQLAKILKLVV